MNSLSYLKPYNSSIQQGNKIHHTTAFDTVQLVIETNP